MIVKGGVCTAGCDERELCVECALRVLFKGRGEHGRGDDSCGEVQRRGDGEHFAEMNTQADP